MWVTNSKAFASDFAWSSCSSVLTWVAVAKKLTLLCILSHCVQLIMWTQSASCSTEDTLLDSPSISSLSVHLSGSAVIFLRSRCYTTLSVQDLFFMFKATESHVHKSYIYIFSVYKQTVLWEVCFRMGVFRVLDTVWRENKPSKASTVKIPAGLASQTKLVVVMPQPIFGS